jgi:anthranilate phosphoribosyltransferase
VHGSGLDEISMTGPTTVAGFSNGEVKTFTIEPATFGLDCCQPDDLKGGDAKMNAAIADDLIAGGRGAKRDAVLLNAAAALVVAGRAATLTDGIQQAAAAIDDGRVARLMATLREESHR